MPKSEIRNKIHASQIHDFSGLVRHRGISPTDIDGYIDYNGNAFLIMEGKHIRAAECTGQKLALKNLADAINNAGKLACAIIYEHQASKGQDIKVAECIVSEVYWRGRWVGESKRTVLAFIQAFEDYAYSQGVRI